MKRILAILLLACMISGVRGSEPRDWLEEANRTYSEGDYATAIEKYKQIIDSGYVAAGVYYNLGNAYFRNHRLADAILYYERAKLLRPRDRDILFNLELADSYVKDNIEELPRPFFSRWYFAVVRALPPAVWGWISLGTFALAFLFFYLYLTLHRPGTRRWNLRIAVVMLLFSIFSLVFAREHFGLMYVKQRAVIYQPSVTVKSTPDESGTDLFVLHEGTRVTLEDEMGEWHEIRISDGNKGWVPGEAIRVI
ncbi:MAG: tetratricopeptide repeat protein [Bacteroidales bacterium]